jgi:RES domain-containing protein
MRLPPLTTLDQRDTHRLVPSRYSPRGESVLTRIADAGDDAHLAAIFELDGATNDRLLAERGLLPGIGPEELVFAVPLATVINAAFCHANPLGSRFAGADRGAWYAGFAIETSHAEVAFHKSVELAEIGWPDESITYDDYQADFAGDFHDLRDTAGWNGCLAPDSYLASQTLAAHLLEAGSLGVVYPSVRHDGGTCLACFRPALVGRVRRTGTWRFTWEGGAGPRIEAEATAARTRAAAAGRSRRRRDHDRGGE